MLTTLPPLKCQFSVSNDEIFSAFIGSHHDDLSIPVQSAHAVSAHVPHISMQSNHQGLVSQIKPVTSSWEILYMKPGYYFST